MARERSEPYPALAASVLLHGLVLAAGLIAWPWLSKPIRMGDVTTVTLMTSADVANLRAAEQGVTPTDAATETPTPAAPAQAAPPAPQPAPTPAPSKTPSAPARSTTPDPFFNDISQDLAGGGRPSPAQKGRNQPTTRPTPGTGVGNGRVATNADVEAVAAALNKIWVHRCDDLDDPRANVDVSFQVNADGYLVGRPEAKPPGTAAADSAIRAVYKLNPFKDFPGLNGRFVPKVHFNAKEACAKR